MNVANCGYCSFEIDNVNYLHCTNCDKNFHLECLKSVSTPGDLLGDVFFKFVCVDCFSEQQQKNVITYNNDNQYGEHFVRQHMSWLLIVTLTLYNLSLKCKGLSHHGFFHWRTHIVSFVDKNWSYLFNNNVRKKKNWIGAVSGTLSHNCPTFFTSGQEILNETGWWKLTHTDKTPKEIFEIYTQKRLEHQEKRLEKRSRSDETGDSGTRIKKSFSTYDSDNQLDEIASCSRTLPYMGRQPRLFKHMINKNNVTTKSLIQSTDLPLNANVNDSDMSALNTVQTSLMDFLAESLTSDDLSLFNEISNLPPDPLIDPSSPSLSCRAIDHTLSLLENGDNANLLDHNMQNIGMNNNNFTPYFNYSPIQVTNTKYNKSELQQEQQNCDVTTSNETSAFSNNDYISNSGNHGALVQELQSANNKTDNGDGDNYENDDYDYDESCQPRIVEVINFQQVSGTTLPTKNDINSHSNDNNRISEIAQSISNAVKDEEPEGLENVYQSKPTRKKDEELTTNLLASCKLSLLNKSPRRPLPWLNEHESTESDDSDNDSKDFNHINDDSKDLQIMDECEEKELLHKLRKIFKCEEKYELKIPSYVRRFYRKLCIRAWKREHGKPLFNIDNYDDQRKDMYNVYEEGNANKHTSKLLNRYQLLSSSNGNDIKKSFYARIAGSFEYELFESPYTQRVLHPFIYRNKKCFPLFLKLMCELKLKVNGVPPCRAPIDFCYVRPNHIAAVNALLQHIFWPGIDMSECLSYPDFSVVALYKKLIIGCGFLVPDVGFNEAYISFMAVRPGWQRSGIATFMLYHLIQTCMTKDITLHVSATNPAVMLYQKFGFKIEEIILNFYDDYLPLDSKHSRHAFFLRLMR